MKHQFSSLEDLITISGAEMVLSTREKHSRITLERLKYYHIADATHFYMWDKFQTKNRRFLPFLANNYSI